MKRVKRIPKEIMVDMERGDIWVKNNDKLTGAELRILTLLRRREGKPVTAEMLAEQVDPLDFGCGNPRFHISNLRRKLGHCPERQVIETLNGIGYCLVAGSLSFTGEQSGVDHCAGSE